MSEEKNEINTLVKEMTAKYSLDYYNYAKATRLVKADDFTNGLIPFVCAVQNAGWGAGTYNRYYAFLEDEKLGFTECNPGNYIHDFFQPSRTTAKLKDGKYYISKDNIELAYLCVAYKKFYWNLIKIPFKLIPNDIIEQHKLNTLQEKREDLDYKKDLCLIEDYILIHKDTLQSKQVVVMVDDKVIICSSSNAVFEVLPVDNSISGYKKRYAMKEV